MYKEEEEILEDGSELKVLVEMVLERMKVFVEKRKEFQSLEVKEITSWQKNLICIYFDREELVVELFENVMFRTNKALRQGFPNFSKSRRLFSINIFTWRPIIYYLFGRAGGEAFSYFR